MGCAALGKVSAAAVKGCHLIWREVMQLWAADQKILRQTPSGAPRPVRRTSRLDVMGAPAAERDPSILAPMHRSAYDQAVIHLRLEREKALAKRTLSHEERRIRGWEGWTAQDVVAWWHTRTIRTTPRRGIHTRKRRKPESTESASHQPPVASWSGFRAADDRPRTPRKQQRTNRKTNGAVESRPGLVQSTLKWMGGGGQQEDDSSNGQKESKEGYG